MNKYKDFIVKTLIVTIAMYKKATNKSKENTAKSASQDIYYGSQRTTLNKFFDEIIIEQR